MAKRERHGVTSKRHHRRRSPKEKVVGGSHPTNHQNASVDAVVIDRRVTIVTGDDVIRVHQNVIVPSVDVVAHDHVHRGEQRDRSFVAIVTVQCFRSLYTLCTVIAQMKSLSFALRATNHLDLFFVFLVNTEPKVQKTVEECVQSGPRSIRGAWSRRL